MSDKIDALDHEHFLNIGMNVGYDEAICEYYILARNEDGFEIRQSLRFCPVCGHSFPPSFRDRWFNELEEMGIDPISDNIPDKFKSNLWRL